MKALQEMVSKKFTQNKIEWLPAKFPLFTYKHQMIRALVAIGLGCDVFDGIKGVGPKVLNDALTKIKEKSETDDEIINALFDFYLKKDKTGLQKVDILTVAQAFLYEPAVSFGRRNDPSEYKYVSVTQSTIFT